MITIVKSKKGTKVFFALIALFLIFFAFFVYYYEQYTYKENRKALNLSADVVAESVWTLFTPASEAYLQHIVQDRRYKELKLISTDTFVFNDITTELTSKTDIFFEKLKLIRTDTIHSDINYKGKVIGYLNAKIYNLNIYTYLLILFIAAVVFTSVWLAMQVHRINMDVASRKLKEEHLEKLNQTLKEKVKQEVEKNRKSEEIIHNQKKLSDMGKMINAISHQWRQPLTALGYNIQDVADAFKANEANEQYIDTFEKESMALVTYLSTTIDDFRYFFQPDKDIQNFNIVKEIVSMLRLTTAQLHNNYINISFSCQCGTPCPEVQDIFQSADCVSDCASVRGYVGEFKQVIFNLIYNSIDAINDNRAKGNIKEGFIKVSVICIEDKTYIDISDNGGGIPEAIASNIFDPYFTTKEESKGTGIGLYMSKIIIENHMNGKLTFTNNADGASFNIAIPSNNPKA